MFRILKDAQADIMLSGGRSQFVALKAKMPWMDVNQEKHHAYAGYVGMVEMVRQLHLALTNPIWGQVRQLAPWESTTLTLDSPVVADAASAAQVEAA
jgi:nitrogenase molybdenum-cofactor synthesis protein NifE